MRGSTPCGSQYRTLDDGKSVFPNISGLLPSACRQAGTRRRIPAPTSSRLRCTAAAESCNLPGPLAVGRGTSSRDLTRRGPGRRLPRLHEAAVAVAEQALPMPPRLDPRRPGQGPLGPAPPAPPPPPPPPPESPAWRPAGLETSDIAKRPCYPLDRRRALQRSPARALTCPRSTKKPFVRSTRASLSSRCVVRCAAASAASAAAAAACCPSLSAKRCQDRPPPAQPCAASQPRPPPWPALP